MDPARPRPAWAKGLLVVVAAAAVAVGLGLASTPAGAQPGFLTGEAAMLTPLAPGLDGQADHQRRRHVAETATGSRRFPTASA